MLRKVKDKLYYYFARKNWGVAREYEPYVDAHREEHMKSPWKHWWILIRLNWHYRILRQTTYLLPEPEHCLPECISVPSAQQFLRYPESSVSGRWKVERLANQLSQYDVVSFDIFDTLVFRPFSKPIDAFYLLEAESGLLDFAVNRRIAEGRARDKTKKSNMEIDIFEIYEELTNFYDIDPHEMALKEIEMETQICYANPYMHEVYEKLHEMGVAMIATSDMYIPEQYIRKILDKCGYQAISQIHMSCEYGLFKADGKLQQAVQRQLGQDKKVIHVDDTQRCIDGCKMAGWKTVYYKQCNHVGEPYRCGDMNMPASHMYRGIVNNYLHCGAYHQTQLQEFGFTYAGIVACGYCEWITRFCRDKACDKILFLARDTDIFYKVYKKYYDEIPSEYVASSRSALQELVFEKYIFEFISHVIDVRVGLDKTIGEILKAANLSILLPYLKKYGLRPQTILDQSTRDTIVQLLLDHRAEVSNSFNENDAVARDYFQKAIGSAKKVCIVGLGWVGSEIVYLKYLMEQKWGLDVEVLGTSLGAMTTERAANVISTGVVTPFAFSDVLNRYLTLNRSRCPEEIVRLGIETFFSSTEPSLVRYEADPSGKIRFVTKAKNPNASYVEEVQQGILTFAEEFAKHRKKYQKHLPLSAMEVYEPIFRILGNTSFVAKTLGDMKEMPRTIGGHGDDKDYLTLYDLMNGYHVINEEDERYQSRQEKTRNVLSDILKETGLSVAELYTDLYRKSNGGATNRRAI